MARLNIGGLLGSLAGGLVKRQERGAQMRRDDRQFAANESQRTFSNDIQSANLARLGEQLQMQQDEYASRQNAAAASSAQAAQARENQRAALRSKGVDEGIIEGVIDSGLADDFLKPTPPSMTPYQEAQMQLDRDKLDFEKSKPSAPRNKDPLSAEGIEASVERARRVSEAQTAGGAGKLTEGERKNHAFYLQAQQANALLDKMEQPDVFDETANRIPVAGRFVTSDKFQQLSQASMQLSDAWLRATSGAAVPEQEVRRFAETFTKQASDQPNVRAQKDAARRQILESLRAMAGRAVSPEGAQPSGPQLVPVPKR